MNTSRNLHFSRAQRGSALVTVMLYSSLLLALVASLVTWSVNERKFNARNAALFEARNAAEAVAEYGAYKVIRAFATTMNPTFGASGTNPLSFPTASTDPAYAMFTGSSTSISTVELHASNIPQQIPTAAMYYIDPLDPNNTYDPLSSRYVLRRDVKIIAKASVTPAGGGAPVNAYVEEKVSVRGAPLFAYAIFYSGNDLEFNPSPQMDIYGPVHVNGNLFVGPVGTAALSLHGPVTASGHVFHAWRGTTTTAQEGGSGMNATTAVNFSTVPDGTTTFNMLAGGVWKDSTMGADSATSGLAALNALITPARNAQFVTYASATWHGNLQTAAMGITPYNPMGFNEVVGHPSTVDILATDDTADDANNVGTTALGSTINADGSGSGYGHGYGPHSLIEGSLVKAGYPTSGDTYHDAKASIEEQKFANKAGLYIKVVVTAGASGADDTYTIQLYADPNSAGGSTGGPNGGLLLGAAPSSVFTFIPYHTSTSGSTTTVTHGMYDQHQDKGVNLFQINMVNLKTALTNMTTAAAPAIGTDIITVGGSPTKWGSGSTNGYEKYTTGSSGWNGGIYIDVQAPAASSTYLKHTGVIVTNGTVAAGNTLVPSGAAAPNGVRGLTIATNAPVYVLGNYNANGTVDAAGTTWTSAQWPDDHHSGSASDPSVQSPCCLAGDAITILSPNYFGTAGGAITAGTAASPATNNPASTALSIYSGSTSIPTAAADSEIAAAFISGSNESSPSATGTQVYSGGVHNMPRFLENWSSRIVAIRGSLVNMYNNRIAVAGWSISYYSPPTRLWGFDKIFANGNFPPICPQVISYRRVDFTYIDRTYNGTTYSNNAAAYAAAVSGL